VATKPRRPEPGALEPARQQHAERLVGKPPLERDRRPCRRPPRGKVSTSSWSRFGSSDFFFWIRSQSATCGGSRFQRLRVGEHRAYAVRENEVIGNLPPA
jgi:hypothetical protein